MANPFNIGNKESDKETNFIQSLFYFLRECHVNPLDETFEVRDSEDKLLYKITKKGFTIGMFNKLLEQVQEHYKKEAEAANKARRH